jgi:hypothetical protein
LNRGNKGNEERRIKDEAVAQLDFTSPSQQSRFEPDGFADFIG